MKYIYTAVFTEEDSKVYARIPDLPGCITTGKDLNDAIEAITDAASGWLITDEDHEDPIPEASSQESIRDAYPGSFSLIRIDTLAYRAETDTRAVRKNVSLPAWMSNLAERRGINCSKVLQEGILQRLS